MKRKYPTTVFINRDDEDDFYIREFADHWGDGAEVAVYQLVKVVKIKKSTTLVDVKHARRR